MPKPMENELENQAVLFSNYLIERQPTRQVIDIYTQAIQTNPGTNTARDHRLFTFAIGHPWSLGLLDAALVLIDTNAELRRRLYVLFSILESIPEYHDFFLPKKRGALYILYVGWAGARGVLRACVGIVLIKVAIR